MSSRHIAVTGAEIRVYCSEACLRGPAELYAVSLSSTPVSRRRVRWWIVAGIVLGGASVGVQVLDRDTPPPQVPIARSAASPAAAPSQPAPTPAPAPAPAAPLGPSPEDEAVLHELMDDAWIHPLAGPHRRMPINHTAAFGAERQGQPPAECLSGHCGVDVGGATWGEQVHAVHDGVVDWVNRGPNEEHGGIFVKLAHRGGALFSWYFHLAAVPRWVVPGARVKLGQVVGLLGDTGVQHSGPHLHFAMTVKSSGGGRERYLDPESLIAIWPLWIVEDGKGHMSSATPPGLPVRAPERPRASAPPSPDDRPVAAARNDNAPAPEARAPSPPAPPPPASSADAEPAPVAN